MIPALLLLACGDLLSEAHKKPANLEFVACSQHVELQGKPLKAEYRVAGVHAEAVEAFLVRELARPGVPLAAGSGQVPSKTYQY